MPSKEQYVQFKKHKPRSKPSSNVDNTSKNKPISNKNYKDNAKGSDMSNIIEKSDKNTTTDLSNNQKRPQNKREDKKFIRDSKKDFTPSKNPLLLAEDKSRSLQAKKRSSEVLDDTSDQSNQIGKSPHKRLLQNMKDDREAQIAETKEVSHETENNRKDKSYSRSNSKYKKDKADSKRSNPKFEYNLEDASESEKELILNGTINDRINCLALLCARNQSEINFKQLLMFCENQRNDVIYSTLKLLRDLIKEVKVHSLYIKNRILKSFDMGCKNQYIKNKVLEIVGVLIRSDVFAEDFLHILVSRLIEKGETLTIVESALKSVFSKHEKEICDNLEDFYFKNDSFRCQYNVLKFLNNLSFKHTLGFFKFYDNALASLDDYPQEQKDLMIELLVNGLSATITQADTQVLAVATKFDGQKQATKKVQISPEYTISPANIDLVRSYVKTPRSAISVLSLLSKINDPFTESYVLKVSRTTLLRNTKYEPEFLNIVYTLENKNLFSKLVDNAFFYSVPSILSLMLIAHEKNIETKSMFSLHLLMQHFHPLVRDTAKRLLYREKICKFDPFDKVYVDGQANILNK